MSKKKKKINKKDKRSFLNHYILASLFLIIWALWFFSDREAILSYYTYLILDFLFWPYYKYIFIPIVFLIWVFMFLKKDFVFSFYRFLWIFFYFLSLSSIFWFFDKTYESFFNFSFLFNTLFWANTSLIFLFLVLFWSIYLVFRINYIKVFKNLLSFTFLKENNSLWKVDDKKISKFQEKMLKEIENLKKENENLKKDIEKEKKWTQLQINDAKKSIKVEIKKTWFLSNITNPFSSKNLENQEKTSNTTKKIEIISPEKKQVTFDWWELPDINLLKDIKLNTIIDEYDIKEKQEKIIDKLKQFKIDVEMTWYRVWPTVIQFRLKPNKWVKLNKIENLKKDLSLALHAKSIRIQAPIPWEWVVWIEVPNPERQIVWLKELIQSSAFNNSKIDIPLSIWKDVNWNLVIWDLTKMPHLLVAGQTASWKSVWINWFIISMLYKFSPNELKMIMIDPKMVELSIYNGIPHLLTPVITSPDKALNSLKWAVAEMLRRYDLAKNLNARNFKEYNEKVKRDEKLPYIVIIIDELADLMMSWNKKEVEVNIARIAQMARAVWMHLIIATQRPSVDVITWLIKANVPSRIAFTVASQIDSRTVIDKAGAEDLLWRGDMLYFPTWSLEPIRVQWVFVETDEIEAIVNQIKLTIEPDMIENMYDKSIVNGVSNKIWSILEKYNGDQNEDPEIIEKAIKIVRESKKWSTSLIQRKLWLWYARAAKVLDILEELWVVWPSNWSKPREVYE